MKFLKVIGFSSVLLWCTGLHADLIEIQQAIEAYDITINMHGDEYGSMAVRKCASCDPVLIGIDGRTSVSIDGKPVRSGRRIDGAWSGGIVIYDSKSRTAVKLSLTHPPADQ
jgi:hypothetical protein